MIGKYLDFKSFHQPKDSMKNSFIEFYTLDRYNGLVPEPYPAAQKFPSWFSNTDIISKKSKCPFRFLHGDPREVDTKMNVSRCPGMIDFLSTGYIVPAWNNFLFRNDDGRLYVNWQYDLQERYNLHETELQITGFTDEEKPNYDGFSKLDSPWWVKTSPGVSLLCTHPLWHREKRFTSVSGVMHTDQYAMPLKWFFEWNTPIEDGLYINDIPTEQIVTQGTPVMLLIPFVRKEFNLKMNYMNENDLTILKHRTGVWTHDWLGNSAYNAFRKKLGRLFK